MSKFIEKDPETGREVVRWRTDRNYTKEELKAQREEFSREAESGKMICLTDLMINHGL